MQSRHSASDIPARSREQRFAVGRFREITRQATVSGWDPIDCSLVPGQRFAGRRPTTARPAVLLRLLEAVKVRNFLSVTVHLIGRGQ